MQYERDSLMSRFLIEYLQQKDCEAHQMFTNKQVEEWLEDSNITWKYEDPVEARVCIVRSRMQWCGSDSESHTISDISPWTKF